MTFSSTHLTDLKDLVVLHFTGADAVTFLQSQLTNAVDQLPPEHAVIAGFCQAKGRLQASMIVWSDPLDPLARYALVKQSIASTLQKRLSLFVLRAKVKIQLCAARVYGWEPASGSALTLPIRTLSVQHQDGFSFITAPNSSLSDAPRAWLIQYDAQAPALETQASLSDWQAKDIYAGLAWIDEHNYEAFLPQDINLDIIGGVNFKKGCFPGQEVVARLHYRTTARRRAALGLIHTAPTTQLNPGQDIFSTESPERAVGRIINIAYDHNQQHYALLMEVIIEGLAEKELFVVDNAQQQQRIQHAALPYGWEIAKY